MVGYRCYILDGDDHILQAHELDCPDDTAAQLAAEGILAQDPYHLSVELWEATRRIRKFDRERNAASHRPRHLLKAPRH